MSFEAFLAQPASQPAPQPASQAHDRLVLSTLGLSGPVYIHTYKCTWASLGLSGPLCESLCLCGSLGFSGPLWASLGLCGPLGSLWASLGLSTKYKAIHNRQLDPQFSSGLEAARRQDHKTHTQQLETQCSSKPSGRQPASQPPSQPAKRMTALFYPRSATLGLPTYTCTIGSLNLSGPPCVSL